MRNNASIMPSKPWASCVMGVAGTGGMPRITSPSMIKGDVPPSSIVASSTQAWPRPQRTVTT